MPSPHQSLTLLRSFLSPTEQATLLTASLALLQSPSHTSSASRQLYRRWSRSTPSPLPLAPLAFPPDSAFAFESRHFDGVIEGYREVLLRAGSWTGDDLGRVLRRLYDLLPPPVDGGKLPKKQDWSTGKEELTAADPPDHLIAHLLHLGSAGAIHPHVDNLDAFGTTIVGASLGGERLMRFKRVDGTEGDGPSEFDVLLEPGSVYIQRWDQWMCEVLGWS